MGRGVLTAPWSISRATLLTGHWPQRWQCRTVGSAACHCRPAPAHDPHVFTLQPASWRRSSTTPSANGVQLRFGITHPFHPWFGREFELIDYRNNWGEDRVCFLDEKGRLSSILASYTDARGEDPFVAIAAGRAHFRYQDLIELTKLIVQFEGKG